MSPIAIEPMPQEFALAHAARVAFFHSGQTTKSQRMKLISRLAEQHCPAAGSLSLVGQLATIGRMTIEDYARQHSLMPVLRVAEPCEAPDIHGGIENPHLVKLVGSRLHTDRVHLCCQCVKNDLSHWSFSWFRRTHNLAGIEMCAIHGEALHWITAPDPFSRLPQHWVDSGEIEQVKFDPESDEERRLQFRLHAMYEIFLERDRPFELVKIRGVLIERARQLGLRNSAAGSKPTLSDYVQDHAPTAWVRRHLPELVDKEKGKTFNALDRLNTSVSTPGTGFAYAVAFAMLFDTEEDAALSLSMPATRPRKTKDQSKKSVYPSEFWQAEYSHVLARMGGNISATARFLDLDRSFLARKTRNLGIPSLKGKNTSPRWLAWQRFLEGESLAAACAAERVEISVVEAMLRTASSPLSKSVGMVKNHVLQSRQPRKETTPVES